MHKVAAYAEGFGIAIVLAILAVSVTHALAADALLFQSDALSLSTYLGAAAFIIGSALFIACTPALLLPRPARSRLLQFARSCVLAVMLTIFFVLVIVSLGGVFRIEVIQKLIRNPEDLLGVVAAPMLVLSIAIAWRKRTDRIATQRSKALAILTTILATVVLPVSVAARHSFDRVTPAGEARTLVLIVLDGMPSQYLTAYNQNAVPTLMDEVLNAGLVFTEARTSAPFTWGYFGTLYTGSTYTVLGEPRWRQGETSASASDRNLVRALQRHGVSTRWMVYHRNGTPEASSAEANSYRGLRSYFLTQQYTWVPRFLALDYHVAIAGSGIREALEGSWARSLFDFLNPERKLDNKLIDNLLPEVRQQAAAGRPTFTLFHIGWNEVGRADIVDDAKLPTAWRQSSATQVDHSPIEQIRKDDYRYAPENEPLAADLRRRNLRHMEVLGHHLQAFMTSIGTDPLLQHATVIVTADHGSMYSKGRFWYGFHPNEEVIRVPLVVFSAKRTGTDDRAFQTPDVTASILKFFDVQPNNGDAISIFDNNARACSASVTMESDVHSEWFFVLRCADRKYVMNLHPDGDGTTTIARVIGYDEITERFSQGVPSQIVDTFKATTVDFGLQPSEIHRAFR